MGQTLVSIQFIIFLILILVIYYSLARRYQWAFLLAVSYFFYGITNRWEFVVLLAGISGINYFSSLLILHAPCKSKERLFLKLAIGFNVCVLFFFKYYHFWGFSLLSQSSKPFAAGTALAVPLGISYFMFKAIAYIIDIYRNKEICEHNIGKFSLFMAFFPEISAGPIDRARNLLAQINHLSKPIWFLD
jgi:D-alanyl-lipoteichoic acid acyltransferase DltB (MBOAT superfamily)